MACASAGCHTNNISVGGPINPSGGGVTATFSSGGSYTPGGGPITITVSVSDPKNTHYGFQMSARLESDLTNGQAGTFTPGANQLVICDDSNPRIPGKKCPILEYIEHVYQAGSQVSTTPYTFTWTPPATNVGPVHFYVAGNAVNGDLHADANDHVYTKEYVLTPLACPTNVPAITEVKSLADFGGLSNFASGSWLEIKGSNFASSSSTIWAGADFNGVNAPTSLVGVSAAINGNPAYVYFVGKDATGKDQIDVEAPADAKTGSVQIVLKACSGSSSAFTVQKTDLAPGLLAPASFLIGGTQYLVAQHQDLTYVGRDKLITGVPFSPAKPGESLTIYGVGFGDVKKSDGSGIPPGVIVTDANALANPITFSFGSTAATLQYKGLAPNLIGLYQFNVVVPDVPDGDVPINVTLNGNKLSQSLVLTVKR
jgi:uncharacterized protein (TIGR03437 family)